MVITEDLKRKTANFLAAVASKLVSRPETEEELLQTVREARRTLRKIEGALYEVTDKGTANQLNRVINEQRNANN